MATAATRHRLQHHLRHALSLSTYRRHLHTTSSPKILSTILNKNPVCFQNPTSPRLFHCSHPCFAYSKPSLNDVDKIDPDTILFEGCDYKHWLIVMDFGKDPNNRPPPEQMVETYVQTLAKVVGSVEEAKKKIYACSTTTYTGFQAEIDEETSKKLEDLPGVIFVLPDSYIDPVNKEYGGDKYINGTIIPRPPPVQYGRIRRDSDQRSRGRLPHRERIGEGGRSTPMSDRTHYTNEGRTHYQSGGNTYAPPQSGYHNQGMPYQGTYNPGMPSQGSYNQGMASQGNYMPSQATYNQGMPSQATYNQATPSHQGSYNQGYTQPPRFEHSGNRGSYPQHGQVNNRQGDPSNNYSQGQMRNFPENHGGNAPQGQMDYRGAGMNYAPVPPVSRADGQSGVGSFAIGQGPTGNYGKGGNVGYDPGYTSHVGDQRFSQTPDHLNTVPTEHGNYPPADQNGMNQRRFG